MKTIPRSLLRVRIHCLPFVLGQRKSFSNAAAEGLSVFEIKTREAKSVREMNQLGTFIYK